MAETSDGTGSSVVEASPTVQEGQSPSQDPQFRTVLRGYDVRQVKDYQERVARELERHRLREEQLAEKLGSTEQELEKARRLDEETLMAALGEQTARVLHTAQEAAREIRARASEHAAQLLDEAQAESHRALAEAESVMASRTEAAELVAGQIRRAAEAEGDKILEAARAESEVLLAQAREQGREALREAQQMRAGVLGELTRRRQVLHVQVEVLRAGKESLLDSIRVARSSLDRIDESLSRAEADARAAAEVATNRFSVPVSPDAVPEPEPAAVHVDQPVSPEAGEAGEPTGDGGGVNEPTGDGGRVDEPTGDGGHEGVLSGPVQPVDGSRAESSSEGRASESGQEQEQEQGQGAPGAGGQSGEPEPLADPEATSSDGLPVNGDAGGDQVLPEEQAGPEPTEAGPRTGEQTVPAAGTESLVRPEAAAEVVAVRRGRSGRSAKRQGEAAVVGVTGGTGDGRPRRARGTSAESASALDSRRTREVDALFERIRATRAEEVERARTTLAELAPDAMVPGDAEDGSDERCREAVTDDGGGQEVAIDQAGSALRSGEQGGVGGGGESATGKDADSLALDNRDAAAQASASSAVRRLKRCLQDEQNSALDRLRNGVGGVEGLLGARSEQADRYLRCLASSFSRAWRDGWAYGSSLVDTAAHQLADQPPPGDGAVRLAAGSLAAALADAVRGRLEPALDACSEGKGTGRSPTTGVAEREAATALGAVYREWRGNRLDLLVWDSSLAVFSEAALMAMPEGCSVRWVVRDAGGGCPDCEDNALAPDTPKGAAFPTGQAHPPAHAGCRCLLRPSLT
ncbi:MAG: DivIVA domain-containing protein [Actinomycetota bacterium]|nr:DivIVA domain-containing protein [Actinomycetota bacterium]